MALSSEGDFPRGKAKFNNKSKRKKRSNFDDAPLFKKIKTDDNVRKNVKKTKSNKTTSDSQTQKILMEPVTLKNLPTGTVILATICKIDDFAIELVTCGGISFTAPIFNISKPYSAAVESFMQSGSSPPNKPQSMFYLGQTLPVKYIERQKDESSRFSKLIVSLNPADVHEDVVLTGLKPFVSQIVMSAAVESVEDHGYVMDLGLPNTKVKGFLSKADASDILKKLKLKQLPIGSVCLCAGVSLDARVIKLTASSDKISKCLITGDDAILPMSSILPGCRIQARIMEIKDRGLQIVLGNEHTGYVFRDYLASEWDLARVNYKIADLIEATVLFVHPITRLVSCTLRPVPDDKLFGKLRMRKGSKIESAKVVHIDEAGNVILKHGQFKLFAASKNLSDAYLDESRIREEFSIGSTHDALVQSVSYLDSLIRVSLKPSKVKTGGDITSDQLVPGAVFTGKVLKMTERGLVVNIGYQINVFIKKIHLFDSITIANPEKMFPADKEVKCRIIEVDHTHDPVSIVGTLKKTLISLKSEEILDSMKKAVPEFETTGTVVLSNNSGVLLEFFNGLRGFISRVLLRNYDSIEESFKLGQLVKCKVITADLNTKRITLSLASQDMLEVKRLKSKVVNQSADSVATSETSSIKSKNKGNKSNEANNECQKGEKESKMKNEKNKKQAENQAINSSEEEKMNKNNLDESVKLTKVETNNLKRKHSVDKEESHSSTRGSGDVDGSDTYKKSSNASKVTTNTTSALSGKEKAQKTTKKVKRQIRELLPVSTIRSKVLNVAPPVVESTCNESVTKTHNILGLSFLNQMNNLAKSSSNELDILGGNAINDDEDEDQDDNEDDGDEYTSADLNDASAKVKKLTRVEKSQLIQANEMELRKREAALADTSKDPKSEEELERCVISYPQYSFYWIKYMTFALEQGDIEKTRAISEKALNSIPSQNEDEKYMIWIAKINLEFNFGNDVTLKKVTNEALNAMDGLKIYTHLAKLYAESGRNTEATKVYETILKKFKSNKTAWIEYGIYFYTIKKFDAARKLMNRSFDSLRKKDHLDVISKFAQVEFKLGEAEKGKNLYESILANHPKRLDIWLIYLSMLIKYTLAATSSKAKEVQSDEIEAVRSVFERALGIIVNPKKVQPILAKYLEFEEKYGSSSAVSRLKHKLEDISNETKFTLNPEADDLN